MAVKLGVIGTGGISHCHGDGYKQLGDQIEFVACCDLDEDKAKAYAEKYGFKKYYTDYKVMLAENELDAVSVCTWNSQHAVCTIAALNAGANVLCEKPMAMNQQEALEMEAAAKTNGKTLMIGFVRRYGNDAALAKEFIDKGNLGEIYYAKASYIRRCGFPGGWFGDKSYSGGGPLIDLGVHVIDLSRYLFGNPKPVSVYGITFSKLGSRNEIKSTGWESTTKLKDIVYDVEDFATAFVRFDNGCVLFVEASFNMNTANESGNLEFFGTKAGMSIAPFRLYTVYDNFLADIDIKADSSTGDFFGNEMKHFIDCVQNGTKCVSPAEDGVELMKILDAIYESAATQKEVSIVRS